MQEQNFEKQVREKSEELSFAPSPAVWQKVEEEIRKKKRRRVLFWILPLFFTSGSLLWWMNHRENVPTKFETSFASKNKNDNNSLPVKNERKENKKKSLSGGSTIGFDTNNLGGNKNEKNQVTELLIHKNKKQGVKLKKDRALATNNKNIPLKANYNAANSFSLQETNHQKVDPVNLLKINSLQHAFPTDTLRKTENKLVDSFLPKIIKRKWQWSASVAIGSSGISTSVFNFSMTPNNALADYSSTPLSNAAGGYQPPSKVYRAFSFDAGLEVEKEINKRFSVFSGLHYHLYRTWNYVGYVVNADTGINNNSSYILLNSFYRNYVNGANRKKYFNNYHFVELPIGIKWQLLKKVPLNLNTGVTVGGLVASNALHYNSQAGVYYKENNLFYKAQCSLFAGLDYRISKKGNASLYLGPEVQYSVTNLLNKKSTGSQHLNFVGFNTRFCFR